MSCIYITENLVHKEHGISPWRYLDSDQNDNADYYGSNVGLKEDIARLGKDNFKKTVIAYYETIDNKELRRIEADQYLKPNSVRTDPSYYNECEHYSPGCGKKNMKHRVTRSTEHRQKIVQYRTGTTHSDESKQKMREKKIGSKASLRTKQIMSDQRVSGLNSNALRWTITDPSSNVHSVIGLRDFARKNNYSFEQIYNSRKGWKAVRHGAGMGDGRKKKDHNSGN